MWNHYLVYVGREACHFQDPVRVARIGVETEVLGELFLLHFSVSDETPQEALQVLVEPLICGC